MKIQKLLPIQDRQYNDQQGQPRVFTSMGMVLTDGIDTLFAEATGDYARSLVGCGTSTGRRLCARSTLDECS